MDSYKERHTVFVKSGIDIGEVSFLPAILITVLPKSLSEFFGLNPFLSAPINDLGAFFKKLLRERKKSGIKYGDLSEVLQTAVSDDKLVMSEDEVVGNILLGRIRMSFFFGF